MPVLVLQPQQADKAVLGGQDFFRLNQQVESGGDIYEINTSSKAIVVGPQSDLSNYSVNYYDPQSVDLINEINLAIDNPIVGRVDALLDTTYPSAGLPGFVLVSPRDLVDNNWLPTGFVPGPGVGTDLVLARPAPRVDIIAYLKNPAVLSPRRDDRLYQFPFTTALLAPSRAFYILPYYGRRYGEFSFRNLTGGFGEQTYTITVTGVNLFPGTQGADGTVPGESKSIETVLFGGPIVAAPGANINRLIKADTDGMFDLISIALTTDGGLPDTNSVMQLLVSDRIS
jgi:hypothetical protein